MASINLEDYPDYVVIVRNSKTGESITGLINNEEISYSTAADIGNSSFIGGAVKTAQDIVKGGASAAAEKLAGTWGKETMDRMTATLDNIYSTLKSYEGSDASVPPVTFHVFPDATGSYKPILYLLYKLTQPNTEQGIMIRSYLYEPEDIINIDREGLDPHEGKLIHLSIGKWFLATGLFCTGISHNFSKFVNENNVPIYMEVTMQFTTHIVPNARQMADWHTR